MSAYREIVLGVRRQWTSRLANMGIDELIDEWADLNRFLRVHETEEERIDTSRQIKLLETIGTYVHGPAFSEGLKDAISPPPWETPKKV